MWLCQYSHKLTALVEIRKETTLFVLLTRASSSEEHKVTRAHPCSGHREDLLSAAFSQPAGHH